MKTAGLIITIGFVAFMAIGWVKNLILVFNNDFDSVTGQLIIRVVGIFLAPIGGVLGWF